jgi:hypothetical protein
MKKYIFRTLALPFIMGMVAISLLYQYGKLLVNYMRFGGEFIAYTRADEKKLIGNVFQELVNQREN